MATLCVVKPLKGAFYNTSYAEAEKMVSAGRAYRPDPRNAPGVFYETAAAQAPAPVEEPEPEPEQPPQTYETRDMTAAPKPVRRRGRPPVNRSKPGAADATET